MALHQPLICDGGWLMRLAARVAMARGLIAAIVPRMPGNWRNDVPADRLGG
jgi:hypothetical protein